MRTNIKTNSNNVMHKELDVVSQRHKPSEIPLIIDTDLGNDIDDALAIILAHSLQSNKECRLLGIAVNKCNYYAAALVDIINTFYGRGHIEIGVVKNGKTPDDGPFLKKIVEAKIGDKYKYKRSFNDYKLDAVEFYRKLLSKAQDYSVAIVSIGFFTNLSRLLLSDPDEHSSLNGTELVAKKVKSLTAMAGKFSNESHKPSIDSIAEFNVRHDIESAQYLCHHWPTEIIFSGHEVGSQILFLSKSIENDFRWAKHHPLVDCFHLYGEMPYDRPTWDPTSVLQAVRPEKNYFSLSPRGHVMIDKNGITSFKENDGGHHRYMIVDPEKIEFLQETIRVLCSKKPMGVHIS